ncbi:DNA modification methylase [Deinococcus peraridilitoris]|uniref:DNA modification methylase n=1 Tax=Deinococcus peraridilitoris (strain DSM 19664 / LMG 22246 / CIP 109416 / KR-200) TaxID=937777 RepID=L0A1Q4_DEIPD|nr:DNA modification methylase [Deinococcus peraridilitoris]AFZ67087.1 DNA modification methylase [Deinococcus peraridilitoris DSM 19664]
MRIINQEHALVRPEQLQPHPRNPNLGDVDAIAESIKANGFYGAIIAQRSTGCILVGHHRHQAARRQGATHIPVIWVDVTDAQAIRILLADNRTAELAERNEEMLAQILQDLAGDDGGLSGTGYDTDDLGELLVSLGAAATTAGLTEDDAVPEVPGTLTTKTGDLWVLGRHRLLCGDSTKSQDLERVMDGHQADLIWTDPPYNVNYEGGTDEHLTILNDHMPAAQFQVFLLEAFTAAASVAKPGACIYIAHAESEASTFRAAMLGAGWLYKQTLIWVKNHFVLSRQDYNWQHEPILYGWKAGAGHYFCGDFTQSTVIDDNPNLQKLSKDELIALLEARRDATPSSVIYEAKPLRNEDHPTMKPVRLVERMILNSSRRGERVLDSFGGSGTTLIAAEKTGRIAHLLELDPKYCDVIVKRWEEYTGHVATLEGTRSS